jgi:acetolactate decarboxylase
LFVKATLFGWMVIVVAAILGCAPAPTAPPAVKSAQPVAVTAQDALVQFSLIAALAAGDYEAGFPLRDVLAGGNFGVGTFSGLDGEMIVLDGKIYQALASGTVREADMGGATPFASVTFFAEDGRVEHLAAGSLDDLDAQLDRQLPRRNTPYAIRVDGEFAELTLRSVPAQSPPFEPLVDVVKHQVTWEQRNVRGTLVGLRCPAWVGTLNVAGYHWHFLSDDRKIGGHVLACKLQDGLLRYDECTSVVIHLPQSREFDEFDVREIHAHDIYEIERQRAPAERP